MDATLAGLLQACVETPDDGTPHLILADWLDDHGQGERAELVRVQCRLADWVPEITEREELLARQTELLAAHHARWLGPLAERCERVEYQRGLAQVWVTGRTFASASFGEAADAARGSALVGQVRLLACKGLARVAARPWLSLAPALSLTGLGLPAGGLGPLLESDHAAGLIDLDLSGNPLDRRDVRHLAASPLFGRLARLTLRHGGLDEAAVSTLLDAATGPRDLDLAGNRLSAEQVATLAERLPTGRVMNSLGMEFVRVPAGCFRMGSVPGDRGALNDQYPQHDVRLTRPFWLGRFAVTQGQYRAVVGDNPSRFASGGPGLPVENVNFEMVRDFCRRLSRLPAERAAGRTYRLPTEAEWEHAARAGSATAYWWGDDVSLRLCNYRGRFDSNEAEAKHPGRPLPVGSYPPNDFGLYEMHGNIWEWTADWYSPDWYDRSPDVDPAGPADGDHDETRAIRGGCWHAVGICCRSAHRFGEEPDTQDDYTGFRVVVELA